MNNSTIDKVNINRSIQEKEKTDLNLWKAVRDFITFPTKYKTYLFYVIILSFYIMIFSCK